MKGLILIFIIVLLLALGQFVKNANESIKTELGVVDTKMNKLNKTSEKLNNIKNKDDVNEIINNFVKDYKIAILLLKEKDKRIEKGLENKNDNTKNIINDIEKILSENKNNLTIKDFEIGENTQKIDNEYFWKLFLKYN